MYIFRLNTCFLALKRPFLALAYFKILNVKNYCVKIGSKFWQKIILTQRSDYNYRMQGLTLWLRVKAFRRILINRFVIQEYVQREKMYFTSFCSNFIRHNVSLTAM